MWHPEPCISIVTNSVGGGVSIIILKTPIAFLIF